MSSGPTDPLEFKSPMIGEFDGDEVTVGGGLVVVAVGVIDAIKVGVNVMNPSGFFGQLFGLL